MNTTLESKVRWWRQNGNSFIISKPNEFHEIHVLRQGRGGGSTTEQKTHRTLAVWVQADNIADAKIIREKLAAKFSEEK